MNKEEKILQFDPNNYSVADSNVFGLPFSKEESDIVLLPVPWDVTVSYSSGTSNGPAAIFEASKQVDLFTREYQDFWKKGVFMEPVSEEILKKSEKLRSYAIEYLEFLVTNPGEVLPEKLQKKFEKINEGCEELRQWVKEETYKLIKEGKMVGLIGGDHSTPLGFIETLSLVHNEFSVLQIDAHADLRDAFEDFELSHASISFNFMKLKEVKKLVQVGIRDFCESEFDFIQNNKNKVKVFFDDDIQSDKMNGKNWSKIVDKIISELSDKVYISFDIDGLQPTYCPNTGTPVPGGLAYEEVKFLLSKLAESGKKIIGFDLNEVAPGNDEWDANVGARMIFHLCMCMHKSQNQ
jgi:agmatinase